MGLLEKPSGEKKRHLLWSFQAGFPISNRERQLLLNAYSLSGTVTPGDGLILLPQQGCVGGTAPFHPMAEKTGPRRGYVTRLKATSSVKSHSKPFPHHHYAKPSHCKGQWTKASYLTYA